jgi:hypothetical protein
MIFQTNRSDRMAKRLMHGLRAATVLLVFLVLFSLATTILELFALNWQIHFWPNHPADSTRRILVILMVISFIFYDIVYVAVVINYSVQCQLIIYFLKGLVENIETKKFEIEESMRNINTIQEHIRVLNHKTGPPLSLMILIFITVIMTGVISLSNGILHHWIFMATIMYVIYWSVLVIVPVIQAARLSAHCYSLTKMGSRIRISQQLYMDTPDHKLDSFLMFTSLLNLRAKLFYIPVRLSCISACFLISGFILLFVVDAGLLETLMSSHHWPK